MKRKSVVYIGIAFVLLIVAIIYFSTANFSEKDKVELTFRITWDEFSGRGEAISRIVKLYNDSNKKVHVTMIGGNEDRNEYVAALNDNSVDVFVIPYRFIRDSAVSEELSLLTGLFDKEKDNYYDALNDMVRADKGVVAVPWIGHSMGIIYNRNLLEQADIDPDQILSMDDLLKACQSVSARTNAGGLGLVGADHHDITWMVSQFIYSFGGQLVSLDENGEQTGVLINSSSSIKALEFYINELGKYAQQGWQNDTGVEVMEAFANEEIAFEIQGPWGITDIWKRGNPFETGAIPLSQIGMFSEVGPLMLSISKDSAYISQAQDFIEFLIDKDTQEHIMDGEYDSKYEAYYPFRVPLRKDMKSSLFFRKYPEFFVFIKGYEKPSINTPSHEWEEIYQDRYSKYLHEAVMGNISIEEALEAIAK